MSDDITASAEAERRAPSGRFVLRISPGLHATLRASAEGAGVSLNDLCTARLATGADGVGPGAGAVDRAAGLLGDRLVGVVAYGSWARNAMAASSDVDLLIVIQPQLRLSRDLYRAWDAEPLRWGGHPVEPHFVHLPDPSARISALWAEVAVDGVVLFERAWQVSRTLVALRRRILAGDIVRRRVHGHPYWVEAA